MVKIVIANRGEIARRILKTCRTRGYEVAVISTQDDKNSLVCQEADKVLFVSSFLNAQEIVSVSKQYGAKLLHPGYGFLSENAAFASMVEIEGMIFVGPTSENMKLMGAKESSKHIASLCGVPTLQALLSHELRDIPQSQWDSALNKKGIIAPFLVKASGGGGGRGMRIVHDVSMLPQAVERASEEAMSSFSDPTVFIERYLTSPRHIEIQVFGDGKGGGVFFGERECSLQRRHQKVIEESPSSIMTNELREKMGHCSLNLVAHTKYRGAGTLEFLMDEDKNFYFLEMNTRIQVEHPVTEMVYGIDLVGAQLDLALGNWPESFPDPSAFQMLEPNGVAIEARILAEDPKQNFMPTPGFLSFYSEPKGLGIRVDSGVKEGFSVNPQYDSMIAKLIIHAESRKLAIDKLKNCLENFPILGFKNNISFLKNIVSHSDFYLGNESTKWIEDNIEDLNRTKLPDGLRNIFLSSQFIIMISDFFIYENKKSNLESIFSTLTPEHYSLQPGNRKYEFHLHHKGSITTFYACRFDFEKIQIFVQGEMLEVFCPQRRAFVLDNDKREDNFVRAPMPGKLLECRIHENLYVHQNDVLFILESMKIQFEIKSSHSGIVKNIRVKSGATLNASEILAEIEYKELPK